MSGKCPPSPFHFLSSFLPVWSYPPRSFPYPESILSSLPTKSNWDSRRAYAVPLASWVETRLHYAFWCSDIVSCCAAPDWKSHGVRCATSAVNFIQLLAVNWWGCKRHRTATWNALTEMECPLHQLTRDLKEHHIVTYLAPGWSPSWKGLSWKLMTIIYIRPKFNMTRQSS